MDAPEDGDIKLQRVSDDLLTEFSEKLTPLLWKHAPGEQPTRTVHRWAQVRKYERLIELLELFQEWPQLLDKHLQSFLPPLVDAFLAYVVNHRHLYGSDDGRAPTRTRLEPLPRAISKILYTMCKVRGVKVISRFLNNEPKYLELMLRVLIEWDSIRPSESQSRSGIRVQPLDWQERYVVLLWLSHLLLAPFDLATLSSENIPIPYDNLDEIKGLPGNIPKFAKAVVSICLRHVVSPAKEREAATTLLARLALRPDMQRLGLLNTLIDWAVSVIEPSDSGQPPAPAYTYIGVLSFIARLATSGQGTDLAPVLLRLYDQTLRVALEPNPLFEHIRSSALARKITIKILRTLTTAAMSLAEKGDPNVPEERVSSILEESIDYFLVALADKDTPVRMAASKALAVVTLKLDVDMAAEVVEAVIGALDENILYEKSDGSLVPASEAQGQGLKPNLSAVDAQRWHGLILTLSHLLFRRAPPPRQLPMILRSLVSALNFEQRSPTGSPIGTNVRDAACFGIWSLARKYTTQELEAVDTGSMMLPMEQVSGSVLQTLAVELVCSACVDPSGNIRRGASAALQELIGRHPNTIVEGIRLVQVVDYTAVARRSKAMTSVAAAAASLDEMYWIPLVNSLLFWKGIGSFDADSRRSAATALATLSRSGSYRTIGVVLERLRSRLAEIPRNDLETRHGCLLAIAETVSLYTTHRHDSGKDNAEGYAVFEMVVKLWEIFNSPEGPSNDELSMWTSRSEFIAEASSRLIASLSRVIRTTGNGNEVPRELHYKSVDVLVLCVHRREEATIEAMSEAAYDLFKILPVEKQDEIVTSWVEKVHATFRSSTGRGPIAALGAVFDAVPTDGRLRQLIIDELVKCTDEEDDIDRRVAAVRCLAVNVFPRTEITDSIIEHFVRFLNDYTTDRRGDIGSLIRMEAMGAVSIAIAKSRIPEETSPEYLQKLMKCICRLAAEKLDKVRFQAWLCLRDYWKRMPTMPQLQRDFDHFTEVSGVEYFVQLFQLLKDEGLRRPLVQGLVTSASAGTEGLIRASRMALVQYLEGHQDEQQKEWTLQFLDDLNWVLDTNIADDRYAIPAMDVAAFLLDSFVKPELTSSDRGEKILRKLYVLVQKAHFKSTNIQRLETAIKIYAALSRSSPSLRADVLKKTASMLLHSYPKIRTTAADSLYVETQLEPVRDEDWTKPTKKLKPQVDKIREAMV